MNANVAVHRNVLPLREPARLSDGHYPFQASGVACGFISGTHVRGFPGFYHTPHDAVDKVSLLIVKQAPFLWARTAWRVANDDHWPIKRLSDEEIAVQNAEHSPSA